MLSTLSLEETGKAWALEQPGGPEERVGFFNKIRRDHASKITQARQFGALVAQFADTDSRDSQGRSVIYLEEVFDEGHGYMADNDHYQRMSGTYIDIVDGTVEGGVDAITQQDAVHQFELAHVLAHAIENFLLHRLPR